MLRCSPPALIFTLALSIGILHAPLSHSAAKSGATAAPSAKISGIKAPAAKLTPEAQLWRQDPELKALAKKLNPLGQLPRDGALGLNRSQPDRVLVEHQLEGWTWIRTGAALENGFVIDRGIMAFEWAFGRMRDDGSFGESKTVEVAHFLGLYARAILFLRNTRFKDRAQRLERLIPRLEISLRSQKSLIGERRWDKVEEKNWMTSQRIQAAASAFWIGRLLANPALGKTAEIWLNRALDRQETNGLFPSGFQEKSKSAIRSQTEALDALLGLAMSDGMMKIKLELPLKRGFDWLDKSTKSSRTAVVSPITKVNYLAWRRSIERRTKS